LTIKVDLGIVFPGLVVLLIGIGLFVLWLLLAILSFFLFFAPALRWVFFVGLYVLVASLVLMAGGVLIMVAATSAWRRGDRHSWLDERSQLRASRDRMSPGARAGELFGLLISVLVLLFFVENQVRGTGFFTSSFGPLEELAFYGSWAVGALVSVVRAAYGRRNAVRPLVILESAVLAVSAFWLLFVFPFDFAHLPDLLPGAIKPAFFWSTDTVGWLVLLLVGVGSIANFLYNSVLYFTVRAELDPA
jgi:hypothetical protein